MHASLACALFEQPGCSIKNARANTRATAAAAAATAVLATIARGTSTVGWKGHSEGQNRQSRKLSGYVAWRCTGRAADTDMREQATVFMVQPVGPRSTPALPLPLPRLRLRLCIPAQTIAISGNALTGHEKRMRQPCHVRHKTQSSIKMQGGHLTQRQRRR